MAMGNGKTPVSGVTRVPMPGEGVPLPVPVSPSRAYGRRRSDKPLHRSLRLAGAVLAIASPLLSAGAWVATKTLVTRPEWVEAQREEASWHGALNETMAQQTKTLETQTAMLTELRRMVAKLEARLEGRNEGRRR